MKYLESGCNEWGTAWSFTWYDREPQKKKKIHNSVGIVHETLTSLLVYSTMFIWDDNKHIKY